MNAQAMTVPDEADDYPSTETWELKKLKPQHQQAAALIAQGMKNVDVARLVGWTPEYITMLLRQPLFKQFLSEKCEAVGVRLDALFEQSVEVIADTLQNGSEGGKLKAARLQLEATKRLGRNDAATNDGSGAADRLERLAARLIDLNARARTVQEMPVIEGEFKEA